MSMPALEDKKAYFDQYWRRQPAQIVDSRTRQRSEIVYGLLTRKKGRLLDIGCGRGLTLEFFAKKGYDVAGVDISPEAVDRLRERGFETSVADLERDSVAGPYDVILCLEVLQQIFDPAAVLNGLGEALADGGDLVVSLPNEFHIVSRLRLLLGQSHLGKFDHSHIRLFSPARDRALFDEVGMKIIRRYHVPIVPPRWKILSRIFAPLAGCCPSLFCLSSIYSLRKI